MGFWKPSPVRAALLSARPTNSGPQTYSGHCDIVELAADAFALSLARSTTPLPVIRRSQTGFS